MQRPTQILQGAQCTNFLRQGCKLITPSASIGRVSETKMLFDLNGGAGAATSLKKVVALFFLI